MALNDNIGIIKKLKKNHDKGRSSIRFKDEKLNAQSLAMIVDPTIVRLSEKQHSQLVKDMGPQNQCTDFRWMCKTIGAKSRSFRCVSLLWPSFLSAVSSSCALLSRPTFFSLVFSFKFALSQVAVTKYRWCLHGEPARAISWKIAALMAIHIAFPFSFPFLHVPYFFLSCTYCFSFLTFISVLS